MGVKFFSRINKLLLKVHKEIFKVYKFLYKFLEKYDKTIKKDWKYKEAFSEIKTTLISSSILFYLKFNMEFEVHIDKSEFTIKGVVMQKKKIHGFWK